MHMNAEQKEQRRIEGGLERRAQPISIPSGPSPKRSSSSPPNSSASFPPATVLGLMPSFLSREFSFISSRCAIFVSRSACSFLSASSKRRCVAHTKPSQYHNRDTNDVLQSTHLDERVARARDLVPLLIHRRLQIPDLLIEQLLRLHRLLVIIVIVIKPCLLVFHWLA